MRERERERVVGEKCGLIDVLIFFFKVEGNIDQFQSLGRHWNSSQNLGEIFHISLFIKHIDAQPFLPHYNMAEGHIRNQKPDHKDRE